MYTQSLDKKVWGKIGASMSTYKFGKSIFAACIEVKCIVGATNYTLGKLLLEKGSNSLLCTNFPAICVYIPSFRGNFFVDVYCWSKKVHPSGVKWLPKKVCFSGLILRAKGCLREDKVFHHFVAAKACNRLALFLKKVAIKLITKWPKI